MNKIHSLTILSSLVFAGAAHSTPIPTYTADNLSFFQNAGFTSEMRIAEPDFILVDPTNCCLQGFNPNASPFKVSGSFTSYDFVTAIYKGVIYRNISMEGGNFQSSRGTVFITLESGLGLGRIGRWDFATLAAATGEITVCTSSSDCANTALFRVDLPELVGTVVISGFVYPNPTNIQVSNEYFSTTPAMPEPASVGLIAVGLSASLLLSHRKRKQAIL